MGKPSNWWIILQVPNDMHLLNGGNELKVNQRSRIHATGLLRGVMWSRMDELRFQASAAHCDWLKLELRTWKNDPPSGSAELRSSALAKPRWSV